MPYIKDDNHQRADAQNGLGIDDPGTLNYVITHTILTYWQEGPQNYQRINDIVGALECAKAEFQRRIVAPYEDAKIEANGDVYT